VARSRPGGEPFRKADGRWCARYYDRQGRRREVSAATVTACLAKRDEALTDRDATETLGAYLDWFVDVHLERRSRRTGKPTAKTVDSYAEQVGRVPDWMRALKLVDVTAEDVETWLDELERTVSPRTRKPLSRRTVQYAHAVLRLALEQAIRNGKIDRNPVRLVHAPSPTSGTGKAVLEPEQVAPFVAACAGERLGSLLIVALALGLRPGEAAAVPVGAVDVEAGTVAVRHNLVRSRGRWVHKATKTHAEGVYELPGFAAAAVRRRVEERALERQFAGPIWADAQVVDGDGAELVVPLLWCREDGSPVGSKAVTGALRRVCEVAGVPRLTPHGLRHSFASLMIAEGHDVAEIAKAMRHTRIATTSDVYVHLLRSSQRAFAAHLDGLAGGPAVGPGGETGGGDEKAPRPPEGGSGG
jgi:integrase